jgi:hypothetical protein
MKNEIQPKDNKRPAAVQSCAAVDISCPAVSKSQGDPLKKIKSGFPPIRTQLVVNQNPEPGSPGGKLRSKSAVAVISQMEVHVRILAVASIPDGAAVVARSALLDESRSIVVNLNRTHVLTARALGRADSLLVRYLCAQAITEFCLWFNDKADGRAITRAIRSLCDIPPDAMLSQSAFATRLAISEEFRALDKLPIYGPTPKDELFTLFRFTAALRSPSDIPNWIAKRSTQTEATAS